MTGELTDDLVNRLLLAQRSKMVIVWVTRGKIEIAHCYDGMIHCAMAKRRVYSVDEACELMDLLGIPGKEEVSDGRMVATADRKSVV